MKPQSVANKAAVTARRDFLNTYKSAHGCKECGERHPACLSFHHRDGQQKQGNLSYMAGRMVAWQRLQEEMQKCDVLCENCHRKHHWQLGDRGYVGGQVLVPKDR